MSARLPDTTHAFRHSHVFDDGNPLAARNTRRAVWLTVQRGCASRTA